MKKVASSSKDHLPSLSASIQPLFSFFAHNTEAANSQDVILMELEHSHCSKQSCFASRLNSKIAATNSKIFPHGCLQTFQFREDCPLRQSIDVSASRKRKRTGKTTTPLDIDEVFLPPHPHSFLFFLFPFCLLFSFFLLKFIIKHEHSGILLPCL